MYASERLPALIREITAAIPGGWDLIPLTFHHRLFKNDEEGLLFIIIKSWGNHSAPRMGSLKSPEQKYISVLHQQGHAVKIIGRDLNDTLWVGHDITAYQAIDWTCYSTDLTKAVGAL